MEGTLLDQCLWEKGEILFYLETLLTGESERDVKEGSGNGHLSTQEPRWGTCKGLILPRTLRDRRTALEMEHLCLWQLCEGYLEGGLLYWGPWRTCEKKRSGYRSLSIGAMLGNLERGSLLGTLTDSKRELLCYSLHAVWMITVS